MVADGIMMVVVVSPLVTAYVTIFGRLARWVCTYYSIGWTDWIPAYSSKSFSRFWAIANWWGAQKNSES